MFTTFILTLLSHIQPSPNYSIHFSKIDNQATIYVNDSLTYNSGVIDGNPNLNIIVSLNKFLNPGLNLVRVELENGSGEVFESFDEKWEIYYELFEDEFPIDYVAEKDDNGKQGLVFSMTHEIEVY